jgi:hypothetical protein
MVSVGVELGKVVADLGFRFHLQVQHACKMVVIGGGVFSGKFILQGFPDRRWRFVCRQDRKPGRVNGFKEICGSLLILVFVPFNFVLVCEFSTYI